MNIVVGVLLIIAAVVLIVSVLLQHGKDHNLSGTIAGAGESFFGKSKASTIDRKLSVMTTVVSVIFVVLVLVMYLRWDNWSAKKASAATPQDTGSPTEVVGDDTGDETEPATAPTTDAPTTEAPTTDAPATEAPATGD